MAADGGGRWAVVGGGSGWLRGRGWESKAGEGEVREGRVRGEGRVTLPGTKSCRGCDLSRPSYFLPPLHSSASPSTPHIPRRSSPSIVMADDGGDEDAAAATAPLPSLLLLLTSLSLFSLLLV